MTYTDAAAHAQRQQEIAEAFWDDQMPRWREESLPLEMRREVPENLVAPE